MVAAKARPPGLKGPRAPLAAHHPFWYKIYLMAAETDGKAAGLPKGRFLGPGDVVAGRFEVDRLLGKGLMGEDYLASDEKSDRQMKIQVVSPDLIQGQGVLERLKAEMRTASQLTHKNIVTTYGMGQLQSGATYITLEWFEGRGLDRVIAERRAAARSFSLRGAYNIVAHVCNALDFAHSTRIHGTLSPSAILVSDAGRVKISDFHSSRLAYMVPQIRRQVPAEQVRFWAPEVKTSATVITSRADVYSLGAMLWELLVGGFSPDGRPALRGARPDLPAQMEEMVGRCLDPEPANRWKSSGELKEAMALLVEQEPLEAEAAATQDAGLDIEIDVERPLTIPPPAPVAGAAPAPRPPAPPRPLAPPQPPPAPPHAASPGLPDLPPPPVQEGPRPSLGPLNLDAIMAGVHDQDAEKWMVTKDKMDHGPFRTREIVQMIVRWEIEGQHMVQNIETGIRVKLRESEDFKEAVERARVAKIKHEQQLALQQSEKAEKRGGIAKIFIVFIVIGSLGLIVGSVFAGRAIYKSAVGGDEQSIDDLMADGKLKIDMGQGGIVEGEAKKKGKRKGGGGGGGGGTLSYDEYMNQGVDLGNVAEGGMTQLSQSQINSVMSSQGKALYTCIYSELKKDPGLKKVSLKFAIDGATGGVQGVTVTSGGSSEFQSCISQKMKNIKFPKFGAPRMGATFFLTVG